MRAGACSGCSRTPRAAERDTEPEEAISITSAARQRAPGPRRASRAAPRSPERSSRQICALAARHRTPVPSVCCGANGRVARSIQRVLADLQGHLPLGHALLQGGHAPPPASCSGGTCCPSTRRSSPAPPPSRRGGAWERGPAVGVSWRYCPAHWRPSASPRSLRPCRYASIELGAAATCGSASLGGGEPSGWRGPECSSATKPATAKPPVHFSARPHSPA